MKAMGTAGSCRSRNLEDGPGDSRLGVDGTLPALEALFRPGKELIGRLLELLRRQEAGRGTVVLAHLFVRFDRDAGSVGQEPRRFDRLLLATGQYASEQTDPWLFRRGAHALFAQLGQTPLGHGDGGIDSDLRMGEIDAEHRTWRRQCVLR